MSQNEFLSKDDLQKISDKIGEIEQSTSGEIRVSIHRKTGFFSKGKSTKELALKEFAKLKLGNTREKTGLLFFILLERKEFFLLADEGLHKKLQEGFWDEETKKVSEHFKQNKFIDGILEVLTDIGLILQEHFPSDKRDNPNEQSNEVVMK